MSNDLVTWATGVGANILTVGEFASLLERQQGAQNGVANVQSFNTAMRQAAFTSAMIGKFTSDYSGESVYDDGNVEDYERKFVNALRNAVGTFIVGDDVGDVNHIMVPDAVPLISAYRRNTVIFVKINNPNTGPADISIAGLSPRQIVRNTGAVLAANDLIPGGISLLVFDGWQFQLMNWNVVVGTGGGGTPSAPPTMACADLPVAGRLPVFGSGRFAYFGPGTVNGKWKVPAGVTSVQLGALAAGGGGDPQIKAGGGGEFAYGTFAVSPGDILTINTAAVSAGGIPAWRPGFAADNGGNTVWQSNAMATLLSAFGGLSGANGGDGGTGGTGGSFRSAGGDGSEDGGGGGAGSSMGAGGPGGKGGGGVSPSGYGGPDGGGGSLWSGGDSTGPGKGALDYLNVPGGSCNVVCGEQPLYPGDFFPGGGGHKNATVTRDRLRWQPKVGYPETPIFTESLLTFGGKGFAGGGGGEATTSELPIRDPITSEMTAPASKGGDGGDFGGGGACNFFGDFPIQYLYDLVAGDGGIGAGGGAGNCIYGGHGGGGNAFVRW